MAALDSVNSMESPILTSSSQDSIHKRGLGVSDLQLCSDAYVSIEYEELVHSAKRSHRGGATIKRDGGESRGGYAFCHQHLT